MDEKEKNTNKNSVATNDNKKSNNDNKKNKRRKIIIAVVIIDLLVGFICLMLYLFRDCIFGPKEPEVAEPTKDTEEDTNKENKLYDNFIKLANKEFLNFNSGLENDNYVTNLCSLEYSDVNVTYCAYTREVSGVNNVVKVSIDNSLNKYTNLDEFVNEFISIDVNAITDYDLNVEIYDVVGDTTTLDKFKNNASVILEKFDGAKKIKSVNYKAVNPNYSYISSTYIDSDGNYRSINEIEYDIGSDKFEITSNTYTFNKDSNATMLDLFNKILA